uniref:Uncharacterized protein n=1 Tax=Oryza meridionalis TaxID=40149 RepID=A0A0E0F010_9ORYZ
MPTTLIHHNGGPGVMGGFAGGHVDGAMARHCTGHERYGVRAVPGCGGDPSVGFIRAEVGDLGGNARVDDHHHHMLDSDRFQTF